MSDRLVAVQGLESTPLEEGLILFNPKSGKFVMLNRSAAVVWAELGVPKTEEELAQRLAAAYADVALPKVKQDLRDVIERLRELELVTPAQA